jgi:hypothetical protein
MKPKQPEHTPEPETLTQAFPDPLAQLFAQIDEDVHYLRFLEDNGGPSKPDNQRGIELRALLYQARATALLAHFVSEIVLAVKW